MIKSFFQSQAPQFCHHHANAMHDFLKLSRYIVKYAFFFSMFVNLLQLTFPIYMLQVYDKVLTSYNLSTLYVITFAALLCLAVLALLEWVRSRLLVRAGVTFDAMLSQPVLLKSLELSRLPEENVQAPGTVRDVQAVRNFLGGRGIFAFFDMPWMPLYFLLIFFLHPLLGWTALLGGAAVFVLGLLAERRTRSQLEAASDRNNQAFAFLAAAMRNAGTIRAMGMNGNVVTRWAHMNNAVLELQTSASGSAGLLHAIVRSLRLSLQVLIYAVGAYLAINHASTAGIMIVSSIIMGRALAPIDQAMATYKQSQEAWSAYKRLRKTLDTPTPDLPMSLPAPTGEIAAESLSFSRDGRDIISNVSFLMPAGQSAAIIGPSGAGKSTLCKLLVHIWPATEGTVRIDKADIASWNMEALGPFIGYLPQDIELFPGTVAENIARLGPVDSEKVIAAAQMAGAHEMILAFPKGYDTPVGDRGAILSGGQRQRVGLARALYGSPRLVVLDEPNSNLDDEGTKALVQAIKQLRRLNASLVLVTHNMELLSSVENIIYLREGRIVLAGERGQVLQTLSSRQGATQ